MHTTQHTHSQMYTERTHMQPLQTSPPAVAWHDLNAALKSKILTDCMNMQDLAWTDAAAMLLLLCAALLFTLSP